MSEVSKIMTKGKLVILILHDVCNRLEKILKHGRDAFLTVPPWGRKAHRFPNKA